MTAQSDRMPMIDALKASASQIIVLHHFAAYGPLADALHGIVPAIAGWLYDYGRMAVQVFLVVGGFLAARSLAPDGRGRIDHPLQLLWRRYLRLAVPFVAALLLAVVCAALARALMDDDAIPSGVGMVQFLAHAALLHDLLDVDALSAGVWYVAIDFQLFALLAGVLWLARAVGRHREADVVALLVTSLAAASLFHFNRDAGWDDWGLYFFGSYALGALSYWASDRVRSPAWLVMVGALAIAALLVDFRLRIAIALAVAMLLGLVRRGSLLEHLHDFRPIAFLGRVSYAVFLVHFPVYLVVSALYDAAGGDSAAFAILAVAVGWACSIAAGHALHRLVEARLSGAGCRPIPSLGGRREAGQPR
jgi:peptidoglycan/LPS O-acetylase OafA/YrhL